MKRDLDLNEISGFQFDKVIVSGDELFGRVKRITAHVTLTDGEASFHFSITDGAGVLFKAKRLDDAVEAFNTL